MGMGRASDGGIKSGNRWAWENKLCGRVSEMYQIEVLPSATCRCLIGVVWHIVANVLTPVRPGLVLHNPWTATQRSLSPLHGYCRVHV